MDNKNQERQDIDNEDVNGQYEDHIEVDSQEEEHSNGDNKSEQDLVDDDNKSEVAEQQEDWRDNYLRLYAEFDNYRRRTLKEKSEIIEMGGENVIRDLLPVLDDMDRAMEAMQKTDDIESVRSGIKLISHKIKEILKQKGLEEIDTKNMVFNTDFHEAIAKIPVESKKQRGKVYDVAQKGYTLKNRVIRHAKVVVGE